MLFRKSLLVPGLLLLLLGLGISSRLYATHGVAGDITYRANTDGTYTINLTTYTNPCAAGVDECTATIEAWARLASGSFVQLSIPALQAIPRSNGLRTTPTCERQACGGNPMGEFVRRLPSGDSLKKNVYSRNVNFSGGRRVIQLRYYFVARSAGFRNIPESDTRAWYISSDLYSDPGAFNDSPQFLNVPYDDACTNRRWTHNPGAEDPEGDTIRYRLVPSRTYAPELGFFLPQDVPGYSFPDRTGGNAPGTFTIDSLTGVITWDTPLETGTYAVGIQILEKRAGGIQLETLREMAIFVQTCTNLPPEIRVVRDTCVDVPGPVRFPVEVRDPNSGQRVGLYLGSDTTSVLNRSLPFRRGATLISPPGTGAPIPFTQIPQRTAVMPTPIGPNQYPIQTEFVWNTTCANIAREYFVAFYARDNGLPPLATSSVTRLRVNPPPPRNVVVTGLTNSSAEIRWQAPIGCTPTTYTIWRAPDSVAIAPERCCDGSGGPGFVKVGEVSGGVLVFVDGSPGTPLPYRGKYCYRVTAGYLDPTDNLVSSCPSNQDCFTQRAASPLLELASVAITSPTAGVDSIRWRQPDFSDPIFGGFRGYRVLRSQSVAGPFSIAPGWSAPRIDTVFRDESLNTTSIRYFYQVQAYNTADEAIPGSLTQASTIFLTALPADERAALSWTWDTPWVNDVFTVFRSPTGTAPWTAVGTVPATASSTSANFVDLGLSNGQTYFYYVHSRGRYSNDEPPRPPIFNRSNIAQVTVRDTLPPCPPIVTGVADCEALQIRFTIRPPDPSCGDDIDSFRVVYRRFQDQPTGEVIAIIPAATAYASGYTFNGTGDGNVAGCFQFIAVDSSGNVGQPSPLLCLGSECTQLQLPNVFTPNGDGVNDVFKPIEGYGNYSPQGIVGIRSFIFDRSGRQLNVSTNPRNLWDGNANGSPAAAGVYFYRVEIEVEGRRRDNKIIRVGTVTLLR